MKLATTTGDFGSFVTCQQQAMAYAHQAGFRYLDYNFGMDYQHRNGVYGADVAAYYEDVKRQADRLGVQLVQAHSPMGAPIAEDNAVFIEDTLKCVDACGAWGIPNLVVHSGYAMGLSVEETFERNRAFYRPLLQRAEQYGVHILVENFNKMCIEGMYWVDDAPDLLAMIEYVDHPLFGAVWDTGHGNLQPRPQEEALRLLGGHVRALHVQDNDGKGDLHVAPYCGTLDVESLMRGLREIGYNGYFTFEATRMFAGAPLSVRIEAERLLYTLGKDLLQKYGCFEE